MISPTLLQLVRCPECGSALASQDTTEPSLRFLCTGCQARYPAPLAAFLDLRPILPFTEQTKYLDEALHRDARHETISPPLLSAAVRNDMLRTFLRPTPGDRILDLGCGNGRMLVWNQRAGAYAVGIDISPFFAAQARSEVDLTLGDLRRLPFADGSFTKAYALDVLEHLSPDALRLVLNEVGRVLTENGQLFVYTHVRRNSHLAVGLKLINRLASGLERLDLIDLKHERLRKSDHLNPLADVPELRQVVSAAGFRIERIRYYTPLIGGFIENILVKLGERFLSAVLSRRTPSEMSPAKQTDGVASARIEAKRRIERRGLTYTVLNALTMMMKLDVWLFGRIETGPFFALLVKDEPRPATKLS